MTSNQSLTICAIIWTVLAIWSIFLSIYFHQTLAGIIGVLFIIFAIFAVIFKESSSSKTSKS